MGETAENVAEQWGVSRERQDAFALESQQRAVAAIEAGRFDAQIVPVEVTGRKGETTVVDRDEHPRADTTLEALARLRPRSARAARSRPATAPGINDGASAVLLVEAELARALGLAPMARVVVHGRRRRRPRGHGRRARSRRRARRWSGPGSPSATST